MRISTTLFFSLFILVILFLTYCSNPKEDYETIKHLQKVAEKNLQESSDDVAKLRSCDEVVETLDEFIKKYPDGEWNLTANSDLSSWQLKRASIQESINRKLDFESIRT